MNNHPAYQRNLGTHEARAVATRARLDPESIGHEVVALREALFNAQARNTVLENNIKRLEQDAARLHATMIAMMGPGEAAKLAEAHER